ncbi:MAG: hypothetical protein NVS2B16_00820 [Chloroflexota bacterium]
MPDADYSHRDVLDKLGIKTGHTLAFLALSGPFDRLLMQRAQARTGTVAGTDQPVDVALATVDVDTDVVALLTEWKQRLSPAGGIWLLSPKRGRPAYVNQRSLMAAGAHVGLVDNKVCSISDGVSAIRFVRRRTDR